MIKGLINAIVSNRANRTFDTCNSQRPLAIPKWRGHQRGQGRRLLRNPCGAQPFRGWTADRNSTSAVTALGWKRQESDLSENDIGMTTKPPDQNKTIHKPATNIEA